MITKVLDEECLGFLKDQKSLNKRRLILQRDALGIKIHDRKNNTKIKNQTPSHQSKRKKKKRKKEST